MQGWAIGWEGGYWKGVMGVYVFVGAGPSTTPASTVPMGASDLLTPVSAGLEGLSLGTKSSSTSSFQVSCCLRC